MTLQERSDIVLAFTRLLYVNGQSTDDTLTAASRMSEMPGNDWQEQAEHCPNFWAL
jgi:hypothetical protein